MCKVWLHLARMRGSATLNIDRSLRFTVGYILRKQCQDFQPHIKISLGKQNVVTSICM